MDAMQAIVSRFWAVLVSGVLVLSLDSNLLAAEASQSLIRAKRDAEAKGYIFVATHDEIVSRAKQEGKLRVVVSMSEGILKRLSDGFRKKFPFIETSAAEIKGTEVYTRVLQEIKAGLNKGQDVNDLTYDYYNEFLPHQKKLDIVGMAQQQVLNIPLQMIDPNNRNIVAIGSGIQVVAYNKKLISADKVPSSWEGFLKPEFADRKFVLDIRPKDISALVPAWGIEKTLDFARKLAAQKPVWARGNTRVVAAMLAGEHALHIGPSFDVVLRAKTKDLTDVLGYKFTEPVPVRLNDPYSVLHTAEHPYAALLWLEFLASPEGQKLLDEAGPYEGSLFVRGTVQEEAARGKKKSVIDWDHYMKVQEYERKIVEAYGFPKAE
jgi:iron(III) transport system substrate-binding protein